MCVRGGAGAGTQNTTTHIIFGHHVPRRYIVVAGDGSQGAYILSPDSEQPDDWSYTLQEVRKVTREGRGPQSESKRAKRGDGTALALTTPSLPFALLPQFLDCHATVGQLAVGDADGDGWTDVFVPCYDSGIVHHYSFQSAM